MPGRPPDGQLEQINRARVRTCGAIVSRAGKPAHRQPHPKAQKSTAVVVSVGQRATPIGHGAGPLARSSTVVTVRRKACGVTPRGRYTSTYIDLITSANLDWIARRFSFRLGVSSPLSTVHSDGSTWNRLTCSTRANSSFAASTAP